MMKRIMLQVLVVGLVSGATSAGAVHALPLTRCGPDAVVAGAVCLDKYEASVWRVPNPTTTNASLVRRIQLGRATRADLMAGGAVQLGIMSAYAPCRIDGQNCANDIYAASLPSEIPSTLITWFQAQEACANSGKRLPASAEWQVGANGTPDPGPDNGTTDCNTASDQLASLTGARRDCVSALGAFDMVGNLAEWVADWMPAATACPGWASFSNDQMCLAGASTSRNFPGALVRGGASVTFGQLAGPLTVTEFPPMRVTNFVGFRCAR
jgi:formylglycine-generating enzyme required for sulfatase activity